MTIRQSLGIQAVFAAVCGIYSLVLAPSLPASVPLHWNIHNQPDRYGSPAFSLWFGLGMMLFMMLMTWGLPKISPKKFELDRFENTYSLMMVFVAAMMVVMHFVILRATVGKPFDLLKTMMVVMGLFFALFGNMMGRVKRNFFMGIRTPWTLANERVWDATHRQAGALWFFGGLAVAVLALIGAPFAATFTIFMAMSIWPLVNSYRLYRKLG